MYGKLMSISDELMWKYWLLLTDRGAHEISALQAETAREARHPMEVKKELARTIVGEFHGAAAAAAAEEEFGRVFSSRDLPADIPEVLVAAPGATVLLSKLLVSAGLVTSNSEARRLMEQGAVRVDGEAYRDAKSELPTTRPEPLLIQVGKRRIARVRFTA